MNAGNENQQVTDQSKMTLAGILGVGALLLVGLGMLIYFFVISN